MDFFDVLGLLFIAAIVWLWLDSLKAREMAVSAARAACQSEGLLLLDETVSIQRLSPGRDGESMLRIRRLYAFEYSDTGNDRRAGSLVMLGSRVLVINLNLPESTAIPERSWLH